MGTQHTVCDTNLRSRSHNSCPAGGNAGGHKARPYGPMGPSDVAGPNAGGLYALPPTVPVLNVTLYKKSSIGNTICCTTYKNHYFQCDSLVSISPEGVGPSAQRSEERGVSYDCMGFDIPGSGYCSRHTGIRRDYRRAGMDRASPVHPVSRVLSRFTALGQKTPGDVTGGRLVVRGYIGQTGVGRAPG